MWECLVTVHFWSDVIYISVKKNYILIITIYFFSLKSFFKTLCRRSLAAVALTIKHQVWNDVIVPDFTWADREINGWIWTPLKVLNWTYIEAAIWKKKLAEVVKKREIRRRDMTQQVRLLEAC